MKKLFYSIGRMLVSGALFTTFYAVNAQIKLAAVYKSGAVLQQGVPMPVWGKSKINDTIFVSINGKSAVAQANSSGEWEVQLPSMAAGGPYELTVRSNSKDTVKLTDIYVGDVWLAAGQSNIEYTLNRDADGTAAIAAANDQLIREFHIPKGISKELSNELPEGTTWTAATSANVGSFSAVGYYFAKDLKQQLNIPIGIVKAAYGGARIEAFMSEQMLGFDEDFTVLQPDNYYDERQPTMIYNKLINPILKFPYKGILWYQGESNGDKMEDALSYADLFKKLINGWRANLGQGDIPFIYIQLPNQGTEYAEGAPQTYDVWPQLRSQQGQALALPKVGEVVTIDVGEVDIHPTHKKPVGERAALVARNIAYGEDILAYGPKYKSHTQLAAGKVAITFDYTGTGLVSSESDTIRWFSIAGADKVLRQAKAKITGPNTVEVWNEDIASPEVIRYAWEYNPKGVNLYNSSNLPAVPFYLNVNPKPFELENFTTSKTVLERGNSAFLQWTAYGASLVTLNGVPVDSTSGITVYPRDTTIYVLKATSRENPSVSDSISIKVFVINPQPTISVISSTGTTTAPNTLVKLIANANAPGGGGIESVTFYIDGDSVTTDSTAPYEIDWTPTVTAEYSITAKVIDSFGQSKLSVPFMLLVTNLKVLTYEAELAKFTGEATVTDVAEASNGKVLAVQQTWDLLFDKVVSPDVRTYQLTIGYSLLSGETEKRQNLAVNGVSQEVTFLKTNPDAVQQIIKVDVDLKAGINELKFTSSWGWMSFDYISIAIDADAVIPPSVSVSANVGSVIAPKTAVTLTADITAPSSNVTKIEFLVNDELLANTGTVAQTTWTPDTSGEYTITARITDDKANVVTSRPLVIKVTALTVITLEAEDAVFTGQATVTNNATANKGKYLDVLQTWTLKFNNVTVPAAGNYELTIGYMLNYQSPKTQTILVNGAPKDVVFSSTNSDWTKLKVPVTLKEGVNDISFAPSWGYMGFDYISFEYQGTVGVNDKLYNNSGLILYPNYPNPSSVQSSISFELPATGEAIIEIVNIKGQTEAAQNLGILSKGTHITSLTTSDLENGLYVIRLTHHAKVVTRTMAVMK